jgi:hypothetical protein
VVWHMHLALNVVCTGHTCVCAFAVGVTYAHGPVTYTMHPHTSENDQSCRMCMQSAQSSRYQCMVWRVASYTQCARITCCVPAGCMSSFTPRCILACPAAAARIGSCSYSSVQQAPCPVSLLITARISIACAVGCGRALPTVRATHTDTWLHVGAYQPVLCCWQGRRPWTSLAGPSR